MRYFLPWLMFCGGCGVVGWWNGTSPVRQTCVTTAVCSGNEAETSDVSICAPKKDQDAEEARLIAATLDRLKAKGCAEPRAFAACYSDATPCKR